MAKGFYIVGYSKTIETEPGVWDEEIEEKGYYGELLRNNRNLQNSSNVIDDINVSNSISILSDPYANENFHSIKYVIFMGVKWKVSTAEVQYPRIILSLGGLYRSE